MSLIIYALYFLGIFVSIAEFTFPLIQEESKIITSPQSPFDESVPFSGLRSYQQLPDIFKAISDQDYALSLPIKIRDFVFIFKEAYTAYCTGFTKKGSKELELLNWSESIIVESISVDFHLHVIQQTIDQHVLLNTEFGYELIYEYLEYTFSRLDIIITSQQYSNILKSAIKILDPTLVTSILKYLPTFFTGDLIYELWQQLIQIAIDELLYLTSSSSSKQTRKWLKIYQLFSFHFGSCESLLNFVIEPKESESESEYSDIFEMDDEIEERADLVLFSKLIKSQPLFSALIKLDAILFSHYFAFKSDILELKYLFYYMNVFISLDQDIEFFKPEKEEQLVEMADTIFTCLNFNLELLTLFCFKYSYNPVIQFVLIHSRKARASIPSKRDQCRILSKLIKRTKFDGQTIKFVWIAVFQITLSDLERYLLPLVHRNSEMILVLLYVMKIVDSAPKSIDQNWTSWNFLIDSFFPEMTKVIPPFIYEAGRILLARHFKLLPFHVQVTSFFREEYCFRDLEWFMDFFISKFRPDISDFKVKINV